MTRHFRSIVLAALALAATLSAGGEDLFPLADDPRYLALLEEALAANPDLRQARLLEEAARLRVPQARALPDPTFAAGYRNGGRGLGLGSTDDTGLMLSVSQAFPGPGKRGLAAEVERQQAERAAHAATRARLELVYRLRRAYADLLLARENLAILAEQRRATAEIEELSRSRYAVGLAGQADVLRAQAELARLEQARLHQDGLVSSATADVNRLLGRPAGSEVPSGRLLDLAQADPRVPGLDEVLSRVHAGSPEVAAGAVMVERSRAALDLARRSTRPDFVAASSYTHRGSLPGMWSVDFGVVLPLYKGGKQAKAVAEAGVRLRADEAGAESMRLAARAAAEKSLADYTAAVLEARAYAKGVLVVDALAVESAIASFQVGKTPFVAVLEAHNTLYRDRWEHAELLFHVLWHAAAVDALGVTE